MNRILMMVLRNLPRVPGAYIKLCHYANHTDQYPEEVKYAHLRYILDRAVKTTELAELVKGRIAEKIAQCTQ